MDHFYFGFWREAAAWLRPLWHRPAALAAEIGASFATLVGALLVARHEEHRGEAVIACLADAKLRLAEEAEEFGSFVWWPSRGQVRWSEAPNVLRVLAKDQPVEEWVSLFSAEERPLWERGLQILSIWNECEIQLHVQAEEVGTRQVALKLRSFVPAGTNESVVVGIVKDITERRETQQRLLEASLDAATTRIAAGFASQLRQSLAELNSTVRILQHDAGLQPAMKHYLLQTASEEAEWAAAISAELVRVTAGMETAEVEADAMDGSAGVEPPTRPGASYNA